MNEKIREKLKTKSLKEIIEGKLGWGGYLMRMTEISSAKVIWEIKVKKKKREQGTAQDINGQVSMK